MYHQKISNGPRKLLACLLCLTILTGAGGAVFAAEERAETAFRYAHDPRLNDRTMEDVVVDPAAVYGFSPSETGSLSIYEDEDWTDEDTVEAFRQQRIRYHEGFSGMYALLGEMAEEGASVEEIARTMSAKRNEIRLAAYEGDPEGLAVVKARNLEQYGNEEGPDADSLYREYGAWETVLEKAFSANSGMDACLGLYDTYFDLYVYLGQIPPEHIQYATREYAAAAFVRQGGWTASEGGTALEGFIDAGQVSAWFAPEMAAAVENGLLKGYEDGSLRPDRIISRLEAFILLSRCLPELEKTAEPLEFSDVPAWAQAEIDRLSAAGLVQGYGDGTLGAGDELTVEQVSLVIGRAAAL